MSRAGEVPRRRSADVVHGKGWPKPVIANGAVRHAGDADFELPDNMGDAARDLLQRIESRNPQQHFGVSDHEFAPLLPKPVWRNLQTLIKAVEEHHGALPPDEWVSLRLDGNSWGTLLGKLTEAGVLHAGFSDDVADAMMATCRLIMSEFGGSLGYTHSDEFTVLVPPGPRRPRAHAGSPQAWVSVAASVASAEFNRRLGLLAARAGVPLDEGVVAHFDCRVGVFSSAEEALSLILWRVSDCNTNSATDAIVFSGAPLGVRAFNTVEKLRYLQARYLLPLKRHQGYGSLFLRDAEGLAGGEIVLLNSGAEGLPQQVLSFVRLYDLPSALAAEGEQRLSKLLGSLKPCNASA